MPFLSRFFFSSRRRHTRSVSAFLLNRSSDLATTEPPSGDLQERVLIRHHDYDQCFQSVQLLQWNSQVKFNVTVYRSEERRVGKECRSLWSLYHLIKRLTLIRINFLGMCYVVF